MHICWDEVNAVLSLLPYWSQLVGWLSHIKLWS